MARAHVFYSTDQSPYIFNTFAYELDCIKAALCGFVERCNYGCALLSDFQAAGRAVLAFHHRRLGFALWMITRTEGDDWIVPHSEDHGYGIAPGAVFQWADSFCSEMVKGNGPRITPRSEVVSTYATAPTGRQVQIKAYIGQPLIGADGGLFGTLCAIHPSPQSESIVDEQERVDLLAAMLSTILQAKLSAAEEVCRSERLQAEALTDALTHLYNRPGWNRLLATEGDLCRRHGHPIAILIVDLDQLKLVNDTQGHAAGDALIVRAGSVLRQAVRSSNIVAGLGGDEFGVLSVECDRAGGEALLKRIRRC